MRPRTTSWRSRSTATFATTRQGGLIASKTIEQFFDPEKNMFLPDRFIKGECPKCHAKDQYGDNCEVCSKVYSAHRPDQPLSRRCRVPSRCSRRRSISSSSCQTRAAWSFLERLDRATAASGAARGAEQDQANGSGAAPRLAPSEGHGRLGHQPRRALFRHRDPRRAGQILLRMAGRAGGLPGLAQELPGQDRCFL